MCAKLKDHAREIPFRRVSSRSQDHFHKWRRVSLFPCIHVNKTNWPHFGWNSLLNFARGREVRKAY